jgi:phenylalanyl-tRNA synthetase beta chain
VDPLLPAYAADRVATLLVEHGGGTVTDGVTYVGRPPEPTPIAMDLGLPTRITGIRVDGPSTVAHLESVGCAVSADGDRLTATPPSWRPDLNDPYDLVEEVARLVGYDQVPSVLPPAPPGRGLTRPQRLRRRVGFALAGAGLVEVKTYPFLGQADVDALGLPAEDPRRDTVRIANPLSEEQPELATTLLPGVLRAAARNVSRGMADLALFETAAVFFPTEHRLQAPILGVEGRPADDQLDALHAAVPPQPLHLTAVLCGNRVRGGWWGAGRAVSWADAVQVVREVARVLNAPVTVAAATRAPWHPGRCAEIRVGDTVIGHAGELHPRVCTAYGVPGRTAAAEVDLDALIRAARPAAAPSFSTYPVAKEDVALVVDDAVAAADVAATLAEGAGELLESVRLFDVYTGEQIGAGKKSLAFALRFRAPDRTLTESEISAARDAAVALAAERHGAVHRS